MIRIDNDAVVVVVVVVVVVIRNDDSADVNDADIRGVKEIENKASWPHPRFQLLVGFSPSYLSPLIHPSRKIVMMAIRQGLVTSSV